MAERCAVAVTGIGVVSALGIGREQFWERLCAGASGIAPIERFPVPARSPRLAAEVRGFVARDFVSSSHLRRMDKLSRMIVAAGRMALDDAGGVRERTPPERVAIAVGSAYGNTSETEVHLRRIFEKGPALASPLIFPNLVLNAPASYLAMELGVSGVNLTVGQGETSGEQAIGIACDLVRSARADVVLAGGGDELDCLVHGAYREAGALSSQRGGAEWCSPYDRDRNGLVLGEGAAVLVVERLSRARERGARIYAELEEYETFAVRAPVYDWPLRARAGLAPLRRLAGGDERAVDLICGSANSSRRLDACELDLFGRLLGEARAEGWLTSIKGAVGEFGAAGALGAAAVCLGLREQVVPPLCNLRNPDTRAPFRFARARSQRAGLRRALVVAVARGGAGVAVSLKRGE